MAFSTWTCLPAARAARTIERCGRGRAEAVDFAGYRGPAALASLEDKPPPCSLLPKLWSQGGTSNFKEAPVLLRRYVSALAVLFLLAGIVAAGEYKGTVTAMKKDESSTVKI